MLTEQRGLGGLPGSKRRCPEGTARIVTLRRKVKATDAQPGSSLQEGLCMNPIQWDKCFLECLILGTFKEEAPGDRQGAWSMGVKMKAKSEGFSRDE